MENVGELPVAALEFANSAGIDNPSEVIVILFDSFMSNESRKLRFTISAWCMNGYLINFAKPLTNKNGNICTPLEKR